MAEDKNLSNNNEANVANEATSLKKTENLLNTEEIDDKDTKINDIVDKPEPVVPSIAGDYKVLTEINLFKALLIKFQRDMHPDKKINSLLNRRIALRRSEFEGPFAIRIISSILMIFVSGTIAWIVLWFAGSALGESSFLYELSGAMATMIATMFGIALFQPFHLIDEKALKSAIDSELLKLKCLIQEEEEQVKLNADITNIDEYEPKLEKDQHETEQNTEIS